MKYAPSLRQHFAFIIIIVLTTTAPGHLSVSSRARSQPPVTHEQPQSTDKVTTDVVNVALVVFQKKDAQIMTGLKKNNFAVFLDGVQKEIVNFSLPDRPIAVTLLVEFSNWATPIGESSNPRMALATYGAIEPAGLLLARLIKSPDDYASVVAFDMRTTAMTDLTNDRKQVNEAINVLLRNSPAFRETVLFDALKLVLIGGQYETAVLDKSKTRESDHRGLEGVQGKRRAIILIASGMDTVNKTNFKQARKIVQDAGVPIFVLGTIGLFRASLGKEVVLPKAGIGGLIINKDLLQAESQLNTIALETGGAYFPCNSESDIPEILESIEIMLRGQYDLAFKAGETHDGKPHNIVVKVDADGDGVYDEQGFVVQAIQVYNAPKN